MTKILKNLRKLAMIPIMAFGLKANAQNTLPKDTIISNQDTLKKVNLTIDNPVNTKYMFWGIPFSDGGIYQPLVNANYKNFNIGAIGTLDLIKYKTIDAAVFANFSHKFKKPEIEISAQALYFGAPNKNTWEGSANPSISVKLPLPLHPTFTFNKLFGHSSGNYLQSIISKEYSIGKNTKISPSLTLSYNDKAFRDKTGFSQIEGQVKTVTKLSKTTSLSQYLNYIQSLSTDMNNQFYGGISLTSNF